MASISTADAPTVQIRLSTRDASFPLPPDTQTNYQVPTSLRRVNLSQLVNNLIHTEQPVPFEFLVNGQKLRSSIEDWLTESAVSAETVLAVEYIRALVPPKKVRSFEHDDWVSAVDILSRASPAGLWSNASIQSGQERILSASYDGLLRVWDMSGDVLATSQPPNNGSRITSLKSAKWISNKKIVAAGMDSTVRVYKYDEDERTITSSFELYGHRWPVEDIAVHGPSNRILSASSDTTISLFSSTAKDNPAAPSELLPTSTAASNKRQKLSKPDKTIPSRGPLATLTGHASPVSSVIFKPEDATVAYSVSHDHTLRTWDLTTSTCVDSRTTGHPLLSVVALPKLNLLATGTSARHITLVDPRASATKVAVTTLRGHANAPVSLDTDPKNEFGLVSGGHDGTVRIWDIRGVGEAQSGDPVYTIERDGDKMRSTGDGVKVFSVRWDQDVGIVSAGEDKRVQINRSD
ncbi:microtubule-associated protein [Aaosphaeria arxii CBS 175.79]|uniref:Ribosome biogenesis protein YTM1 n=1 Tax=Aaosphaeria arxii CBS 175.79 TaxID=1450172 RepID=A0A6A5XLP1_9PLEO|nr:microtubule-associated protein [Aaosphaeria arxii CBS 175.79]KAF2013660.1 microtubule-associated protein [Aaosphaeria arxii CBS 175.79]